MFPDSCDKACIPSPRFRDRLAAGAVFLAYSGRYNVRYRRGLIVNELAALGGLPPRWQRQNCMKFILSSSIILHEIHFLFKTKKAAVWAASKSESGRFGLRHTLQCSFDNIRQSHAESFCKVHHVR